MTRRRFVFRDGEFVELDLEAPLPRRIAPYVQGDIDPYHSVITGRLITSRSEHRTHLRQHGMIEVGNEMPQSVRSPAPPVATDIIAALEASPERHAEAAKASERATVKGPPVTRILP